MNDFGKRLKEERERIGLSQAKFADACGVGKTAQYTYEKGEREPSWSYMSAAEKLGADALYIFTGIRAGKDLAVARSYSTLMYTVEMLLGLEEGHLEELCKEVIGLQGKEVRMMERTGTIASTDYDDWQERVVEWLGTSRKPERCIDVALLVDLVDRVEHAATRLGAVLSREKSLRVALVLYRDAKPQKNKRWRSGQGSGEIRQVDIDEAVRLAAG